MTGRGRMLGLEGRHVDHHVNSNSNSSSGFSCLSSQKDKPIKLGIHLGRSRLARGVVGAAARSSSDTDQPQLCGMGCYFRWMVDRLFFFLFDGVSHQKVIHPMEINSGLGLQVGRGLLQRTKSKQSLFSSLATLDESSALLRRERANVTPFGWQWADVSARCRASSVPGLLSAPHPSSSSRLRRYLFPPTRARTRGPRARPWFLPAGRMYSSTWLSSSL